MIILDIDDTLIDHSGAESKASTLFGAFFCSDIPAYNKETFPERWQVVSQAFISLFLAGIINFKEQRRGRIREIFKNDAMKDSEADDRFSVYLNYYENSWCSFPDVLPFLEKYGSNGVGVISDGEQEQQEKKLRTIGIESYISFVLTPELTGFSKPDARVFYQACTVAKVMPSNACYIGDNLEKDVIGANAAGLRGIWINRTNSDIPEGIEAISNLMEYSESHLTK